MLKKFWIFMLLASFQVQSSEKLDMDNSESVELTKEDLDFMSTDMPEESEADIVRKKKIKKFCSILVKSCAKIAALKVCGNTTICGNLTVAGQITSSAPLVVAAPLTVAAPISTTGPLTIGDCVLTCTSGGLVVTTPAGSGTIGGLGYGYIYNLTAQTIGVGLPVPFSSNGPLLGITHTPSSPSIGIVSAGTYAITFSVSGTEPNQFAIFVNGAPNASTIYGSGAGTQQNTGHAILTLGAGDVITLVNHTSASAVGLASVVGGTQANVNASVLIQRLA